MITLEAKTTPEAVEFVWEHLEQIGTLEKITHERNIREVYYKTSFIGAKDTITILGGLASGFNGSGPDGLFNVLIELGVFKDKAQEEIYTSGGNVYQFEIEV